MQASQESQEPLQARLAVEAPAAAPDLRAGSVVEFMVMPAGTHTGCFGQGNRAVERTVKITEASAAALEGQLSAVNGRGKQKAFFDFDHRDEAASAWPLSYLWREAGVFCRAELSAAGAEAIAGKNYRAFSPVFYVDREDPANVVCRDDAGLNFGSLVNDPAFHEIAPLWAKSKVQGPKSEETISAAGGAGAAGEMATGQSQSANSQQTEQKGQSMEPNGTAVAATAAQSAAAPATASVNTDALTASNRIAELEARAQRAEAALQARRKQDATEAVAGAVKRGAIPAKDDALKAKWQALLEADPANLALLAAVPDNSLLTQGSLTRAATASAGARGDRLEAKEGPARVLQAYGALVAKNAGIPDLSYAGFQRKGEHAREMAALYAGEIAPRWNEFRDLPLRAADYADPAGNLGTLTGTLVAQRTLELFKLEFPIISRIFTDFSDTPAQFKQTEATRILVVPAVQTYSTTTDGTGRPQGWSTASPAQTKDVLITLDEHVGIPIVFDANTLASTMRRLFDEQAPAASYSLAKYFVEKIYKLFSLANYNAYAAVSGVKVPVAYAKFPVALGDFARSSLTKLATIFNPNEVPIKDRVVLLNSTYFEQLATDPSLVTFFSGQQAPEIVTENRLPRLAGFEPIEAPNLAAPAVTPNLVGMALHKAAVVAKARLSNDYTQALPGASYGSVTTITDPDIGISVVLVQYVNHTGGYAEWRIQVMLGAAVGDSRGGLCITSQ